MVQMILVQNLMVSSIMVVLKSEFIEVMSMGRCILKKFMNLCDKVIFVVIVE